VFISGFNEYCAILGHAPGMPPTCPPHAPVNPGDYGGACPGHGSDDLIEVLISILNVNLFQILFINLSRYLPENLSEIISESISGSLSGNLSGIIPGYYFHHSEIRFENSKIGRFKNCRARL